MRSHLSILGVFVLLLGCVSALPTAEAARKKKPKAAQLQLETYPALEEIEVAAQATPREIRVNRTEVVTTTESLDRSAERRALEERVALLEKRMLERSTADAVAIKTSTSSTSVAYEAVPGDKTDMIAARLKLVEMILRESGRAYDYRALTSSQLRRILDEVRSNAKLAE